MRYGDLDALEKKLFPMGMVDGGNYVINAKAVKMAIASQPTVDAVVVVRCKDCTHGSKNEDGSISCNCFMADSMPPTGFCSFGERKVILRMIKNPDTEAYETATEAVKANDGYCPCLIYKTPDTKCPCKDFREQEVEGECHCGRYVKITE